MQLESHVAKDEVRDAIRVLYRHGYRSASNVAGEFVEKMVAASTGGELAQHCQKGFDLTSKSFGKVEVKSRNYYAKSVTCTLPVRKLEALDNFILVILKDGEIHQALLFDRATLESLRSTSGHVYVDRRHHARGLDITHIVRDGI